MAKPICKAEGRWAWWRWEAGQSKRPSNGFPKWAKRLMAKARRRYLKVRS